PAVADGVVVEELGDGVVPAICPGAGQPKDAGDALEVGDDGAHLARRGVEVDAEVDGEAGGESCGIGVGEGGLSVSDAAAVAVQGAVGGEFPVGHDANAVAEEVGCACGGEVARPGEVLGDEGVSVGGDGGGAGVGVGVEVQSQHGGCRCG